MKSRPASGCARNPAGNGDFNFDTANFAGNLSDYIIAINDNGTPFDFSDDIVTVTDGVVDRDGSDRLTHIERLQFADQSIVLVPGLNSDPLGQLTILDAATNTPDDTPTEGQLLRVSIADVTDGDNISPTNPTGAISHGFSYVWQVERNPGTGVFKDIVDLAGDLAFQSANGTVFRVTPDLAGLSLRVKAIYQDANGVLEQVFSAPTDQVINPDVPAAPGGPRPGQVVTTASEGVHYIRADLDFILNQIRVAEHHAAGGSPLPGSERARGRWPADGGWIVQQSDPVRGRRYDRVRLSRQPVPRLTDPVFRDAEGATSYEQTSGFVFNSQPRVISNLVADQTANNPSAYAKDSIRARMAFSTSAPRAMMMC